MDHSVTAATCSTLRSVRFITTPLVRGLTLTGVMLAITSLGLSQASAVVITQDHFAYTNSSGEWLPEEVVYALDGTPLNSGNSANGVDTDNVIDTTTLVTREVATHAADLATATVRAYTQTQIVSQSGPTLEPEDLTLQTLSAAGIADTFTITAANGSVLLPGAVATVTFTIDGHFNLPAGVDFESGDFFSPYNAASAQGNLLLFETGALDLFSQAVALNPNDFASTAAYNNAYTALLNGYQNKQFAQYSETLHTHAATVDLFNDPHYRLAANGAGQMILTAEIALTSLDTSFEWLAQLTTQTVLDGSAGVTSIEADFASTGVLTIALPKGFSVTSGSGLFPQSNVTVLGALDTNPVPEPLTAALGMMSLAGLMFAARRRRLA